MNTDEGFRFALARLMIALIVICVFLPSEARQAQGRVALMPQDNPDKQEPVHMDIFKQLDRTVMEAERRLNEQEKKIRKYERALEQLQYKTDANSIKLDYIEETERQKQGKKAPGANYPLPFAHFAQEYWQEQVENFRRGMAALYGAANVAFPGTMESAGYVEYMGKGDPIIDGIFAYGFSYYDLVNNIPNIAHVEAPGLVSAAPSPLIVDGDAGMDAVSLDGCLKWKKIAEEKSRDVWEATDKDEKKNLAKIARGVTVTIESSCDSRYFMPQVMHAMPMIWGLIPNQIDEATYAMTNTDPIIEGQSTKPPAQEEDIATYETGKAAAPDDKKASLEFVIKLMREKLLPARYPYREFTDHDPAVFSLFAWQFKQYRGADPSKFCDQSQFNDIADGQTFKCGTGNFIFANEGTGGADIQQGNSIFFGNKGAHTFKSGRGNDIIVLKQGWGKQTIDKVCGWSHMKDMAFALKEKFPNPRGGFGVTISRDEIHDVIISLDPNGAAEKAGLKSGDIITAIDGKSVTPMSDSEVMSHMRGKVGTPVTVSRIVRDGKETPTVTFNRGPLGPEEIYGLRIVEGLWPYDFSNFIVFGEGIHRDHMKWNDNHTLLENSKTGDVIEFTHGACYNLVFASKD